MVREPADLFYTAWSLQIGHGPLLEPEATNDLQAETPHDASGGTPASEEPGRLAHACYAFDGKGEGELPLVVGQELEILDDLDLL